MGGECVCAEILIYMYIQGERTIATHQNCTFLFYEFTCPFVTLILFIIIIIIIIIIIVIIITTIIIIITVILFPNLKLKYRCNVRTIQYIQL